MKVRGGSKMTVGSWKEWDRSDRTAQYNTKQRKKMCCRERGWSIVTILTSSSAMGWWNVFITKASAVKYIYYSFIS